MDKYEMLKSIGFSESYISHLKKVDSEESNVFGTVADYLKPLSNDVSNITINRPLNMFVTQFKIHPK